LNKTWSIVAFDNAMTSINAETPLELVCRPLIGLLAADQQVPRRGLNSLLEQERRQRCEYKPCVVVGSMNPFDHKPGEIPDDSASVASFVHLQNSLIRCWYVSIDLQMTDETTHLLDYHTMERTRSQRDSWENSLQNRQSQDPDGVVYPMVPGLALFVRFQSPHDEISLRYFLALLPVAGCHYASAQLSVRKGNLVHLNQNYWSLQHFVQLPGLVAFVAAFVCFDLPVRGMLAFVAYVAFHTVVVEAA
jgi:hypothetical protein